MEPTSVTVLAGKIIFTGFCLAVGFWAGKKVTNRIDEFIFCHSKEYREIAKRNGQNSVLEMVS